MLHFDPFGFDDLARGLILVTVAIAAVTDVRRRRIYNALTFPAIAVGLDVNGAADGVNGLLRALAGAGHGIALFVLPVAFLGRGAGDLKLLAAIGALGGPVLVAWCALYTSAAGGVFAVTSLIARRRFRPVIAGLALDVYTLQLPQATSNIRLPYAIPIAAGAIATMFLHQ